MALTGSKTMPEFTAHTFTVQTALTGSRMMPKSTVHTFTKQTMSKSLPSQCKRLWQGQWWCPNLQCMPSQSKRLWHSQWRCPNLYLHSANSFDRVKDDAQIYSACLHKANDVQIFTFTMQTALTGSMMMPKSTVHTFTKQTALTQSMTMSKSLPSQCKWLWEGQWRCPSTYLHSANSFDRVNDEAQVYSAYLHSANSFDRVNDDAVFLQLPFVDLEVALVSNALPQFVVIVQQPPQVIARYFIDLKMKKEKQSC